MVLPGDLSCNNVFLDEGLDAKLGDFAGSAIDGLDPLVGYETSSRKCVNAIDFKANHVLGDWEDLDDLPLRCKPNRCLQLLIISGRGPRFDCKPRKTLAAELFCEPCLPYLPATV